MRAVPRLGAVVALLLLFTASVWAASFTVRSEVDARRIGVQDQLQLTITVEGSGGPDEVPLPVLTNLEVVGGPFRSSQISVVNGLMSQSRSYTYALQLRAAGKAEIGPVTVGDQTAPAIPIEVVAGSVRPREGQRPVDPFGRDPWIPVNRIFCVLKQVGRIFAQEFVRHQAYSPNSRSNSSFS